MKSEQLNVAIHSIQMLTLLQKAVSSDKPFEVRLSKIRAYIERATKNAVIEKRESEYITKIALTIRHFFYYQDFPLDLKKVIDVTLSKGYASLYELQLDTKNDHAIGLKKLSRSSLAASFEFYIKNLEEIAPEQPKKHDEASKVEHKFSSVVRNSDWLCVLQFLNIKSGLDVMKCNKSLTLKYSTRQGLAEMPDKFKSLTTSEEAVVAKVSKKKVQSFEIDVKSYNVFLTVKPSILMALHPVTELMNGLALIHNDSEMNGLMTDLIIRHSLPFALTQDQTIESATQAHMDKFKEEFESLAKKVKITQAKRAKESLAFKKEKTLKVLRGLDAATLNALRANPELLSEV